MSEQSEVRCKHCGRRIEGIVHVEGAQWHLMRCDTEDSGLPYGYNAEPEGVECIYPCRGWKP